MIVEKAFSSLHKAGEELCGDRVLLSETPTSIIAVLSDGLGSGVKANILATITTRVAMTMLENGAKIDEVVSTLARTLPVCKVRKLAYSTFTIIQVHSNGTIYVAEFDNPTICFFREGRRMPLKTHERVIGSLVVQEASWQGKENDMLVAVSDGVVHAGIGEKLDFGWTHNKLETYLQTLATRDLSAVNVCEKISNIVERISQGVLGDDSTVLTIKLRKKRSVTVAVGPPVNMDDDRKFTQKLLCENQTRVICGGTTATLIARELGTDVIVDLNSISEHDEVPPTGAIEGISLVTEGILTLSTVLQYFKANHFPQVNNGAVRLGKTLQESDEINFLVGRAINAAHQNPDLPVHLSLKQQLIQEFAKVLQDLGKKVTVEYY